MSARDAYDAETFWLESLLKGVTAACQSPSRFDWFSTEAQANDSSCVELCFYPQLGEVAGGAHDGARIYDGYSIDVVRLLGFLGQGKTKPSCSFSTVEAAEFPYPVVILTATGEYDGRQVTIRFYPEPLPRAQIGYRIDGRRVRAPRNRRGGRKP